VVVAMSQDDANRTVDAYAPAQIALLVERGGVAKVALAPIQTATLGILGGAFISFGAMFYTLTITGGDLGFGPSRLLGGVAFSLGLILVLVGGAELFTGNNLIVMAWAERKVTSRQLLRNWVLVYLANFVGALGTVALFYLAGALELSGGAVGQTAARIAETKLNLDFSTAFFRGILCNTLVCLAVWLNFAARDVAGKILAIIFPISAFVALGFEHSVANMYLIPLGMLANGGGIDFAALLRNLLPVTLGNIVGGSGLVALTYWLVYLRSRST
jgi:formate/nitrite transporter